MKRRSAKSFPTTSLCYSDATCKATLTFPLTSIRLEQTKQKFQFFSSSFFLSSCLPRMALKLYCGCESSTYQRIAKLVKIIPTCFELCVSYYWRVMTSPSLTQFSYTFGHFFGFLHNNCLGMACIAGHNRTTDRVCHRLRRVC